jgi:hypothetical protein
VTFALAILADEAAGAAAEAGSKQGGWPLLVFAVVTMPIVAFLAWRLVQRQERGDATLEAKLKADDERAERGRRGE